MLNKAMLLACAGKKKVVPTNGKHFSTFSVTIGPLFGGSIVGYDYDETGDEGFELISGEDIGDLSPSGVFFRSIWSMDDNIVLMSSPHLSDSGFASELHVCGLVNEETGDVGYGVYPGFTGLDGWHIMFSSYESAKLFMETGDISGEDDLFCPIISADTGKTFTFSFYICD